jgi:AcrR family transcriptional regulator
VGSKAKAMQRPNGRSARIRDQVHHAVLDLVDTRDVDELTVPLVAERSGVHPATIYRRWGDLPTLLQDVVAEGPARTSPLPDTGTLRGDLNVYAVAVARTLRSALGVLLLRTAVSGLSAGDGPGPSPLLIERSAQLRAMLQRAAARGEHPPAVTELLELVVAPLYFHALFGQPASDRAARRLVDRLLAITQ